VAERALEIESCRDCLKRNGEPHQRRQQVEYVRRRGVSYRVSCALSRVARSSLRLRIEEGQPEKVRCVGVRALSSPLAHPI